MKCFIEIPSMVSSESLRECPRGSMDLDAMRYQTGSAGAIRFLRLVEVHELANFPLWKGRLFRGAIVSEPLSQPRVLLEPALVAEAKVIAQALAGGFVGDVPAKIVEEHVHRKRVGDPLFD